MVDQVYAPSEANWRGDAMQKVYAVEETITPEVAVEYLSTTIRNRPIKKPVVRRLVGAIERGEWVFNGETIKFDVDGHLIDGQHRLEAVKQSEKPIRTLVVRNATDEAQDTVDTGTRRTLLDALRMRGEKNAAALSAGIAWLHRLQIGESGAYQASGHYPTIQQGLALLDENPGLRDCMSMAYRVYVGAKIPQSVALAMYYHLSFIDEQDADVFFEHVATGVGLDEGHPILVLRTTTSRLAEGRPKPPQIYFAALVIKAWNAFKEGRTIQRLTWSPGGSRQERFPEIRAY